MLRVRLIGGLGLELDGAPIAPPRSRRGRALLAWLALHPGAHQRSGLAARFWPDVLDESARASLRAALTELRAALGPAADRLVATRETVALDGDDMWVDAREFTDLLAAGRDADAVELGAGELLAGLEDEWVLDARQRHAQRLAETLEALAARAESAGDLAEAVARSREAVALDPLDEGASRRLIERLRRSGDDAAALAVYDRLAARLRAQLGVAPSAATRELAQAIRDHARRPPTLPAVPAPAALRRPEESPFVGRTRELERLRAAWAGTQLHGTRRLVLLAGEPGIGKTRLAMRLAAEADEQGALVLAGRCWEEPLGAYGPFAEALRQCADALGLDGLQALAGPTGGELARVLGGELPAGESDDPGARHRLFDAVDAVLAGLARERPLLLVLDDLHSADRPTLLMLAFLLGSSRPAPMLLLGTYRDTELGRRSPLTRALADLSRSGGVDRLRLGGLGRDDVVALARAWLGAQAGEPLAGTVHERTAGNAFFTEEVLRGLVREEQGAVPESVRQAVGARLARLSEAANGMLAVAAVLGGEFDSDVLAAASELSGTEAEAALDELLDSRLLRPGASRRALEFSHALVREVVDHETNALRRSRLHRRIADVLIARGADQHLEDVARHLFESGAAGDEERTAGCLARAGRRSLALLAYEDAAGWFERALQVTGPRGELLLERGDALLRAGEPDAARACFAAAAELAREQRDPRLLARAALGHAGLGVTIIDVDSAAVALLEEALTALGDDGGEPALRSRLLARLAVELYYAPRRDRSEALGAQAVSVARESGDQRAVAAALAARHVALWRPDRLAERLEVADEMIAAARAAGDGQLELQGRNWRAVDLFEAGDLAGWREEAARHAELAGTLRLPSYAWYGPLWAAVDALHQGRFAEATPLREEARTLGTRAGDANAELFAEMLRVQEHFLRGTVERLDIGWVEEKIERSAAGPAYVAGYAWGLAELGRAEDARAQLDRLAADDFAALPFDANWPSAMGEAAEAVVLLRDPTHAAALYERLAPYAGRPLTAGRAVVSYGVADRHLAGLAVLLGRRAKAERHFEAALELNTAMGLKPWVARTQAWREALGQALG